MAHLSDRLLMRQSVEGEGGTRHIDHFRNSEIYKLLRFPDSDRNPADLSLAAERDDEENYD